MRIIYDPKVLEHNPGDSHIEGSYRLKEIEKVGIPLELEFDVGEDMIETHTLTHLLNLRYHCRNKIPIAEVTPNEDTLESIYSSVRLAIHASENNDFAITRPPGHHADADSASGFCFVNNGAIAAQRIARKGKRVCIIDIDGHHGDGTEEIFYQNNKVLFLSLYQEGSFPYISNPQDRIGSGSGKGFNLHLPIPRKSGDDIFLESMKSFEKYVKNFNPDVVGVSAGFDGYKKDMLLDLNYSLAGYNRVGSFLRDLKYPMFCVLEGGYHGEVVDCVKSFVDGVNGISLEDSLTNSDNDTWRKFRLNISKLEKQLGAVYSG